MDSCASQWLLRARVFESLCEGLRGLDEVACILTVVIRCIMLQVASSSIPMHAPATLEMSLRFLEFDFQLKGKSETMIVLSILIPVKLNTSFDDADGKLVSSTTRFLMSSSAAQSSHVANAKIFGLGSTQR